VKALKRFASWVVSRLFGTAESGFLPSHHLTHYGPRREDHPSDTPFGLSRGAHQEDYLAGYPRHAYQEDHLAGFPRRAAIEAVHSWKIPRPPRLPVDD